MDAIDNIIAEIDRKAAQERNQQKVEEEGKIIAWYEKEVAKAKALHEEQLTKQSKTLEQKFKQLASRQQMDVRQETLVQKQDYLDQLFEEAYDQMKAWDKEAIQRFAKHNLKALDLKEAAVLLPAGPKVTEALTKDFIQSLNLSYPLGLGKGSQTSSAGFLVDVNGVQYNFLFRDLLQEVRNQAGNELSKKLFS